MAAFDAKDFFDKIEMNEGRFLGLLEKLISESKTLVSFDESSVFLNPYLTNLLSCYRSAK
jgi:hypothetical protein